MQHRLAADLVQRLGPARFHTRALAGGEDDGSERHKAKDEVGRSKDEAWKQEIGSSFRLHPLAFLK